MKKELWIIFKKNWLLLIGVTLLFFIVPIIVDLLMSQLAIGVLFYLSTQLILFAILLSVFLKVIYRQAEIDSKRLISLALCQIIYGLNYILFFTVIFALPSLWLMVRLRFSSLLIIEEGVSAKEALKKSFAITKGSFWGIISFISLIELMRILATFSIALIGKVSILSITPTVIASLSIMALAFLYQTLYYDKLNKVRHIKKEEV